MDMALGADDEVLAFGRWVLWPRARKLVHDGRPVELGARAFDLLVALLRADGELLTKDALMGLAWPGVIVEENNLHTQIGAIRRALASERDAIVTVAGRGYRFALPVRRRPPPDDTAEVSSLSVAVLPFHPIGNCSVLAALADGITDSLTTDLARVLSGGTVATRSSAAAAQGRAATAREIGRELGVRYVLEGSVAAGRGLVRVNARLVDAAADTHLWAERFDQPRGEGVLDAQDAIVARLARLVAIRVMLAEAHRVAVEPGSGPEQMVLQARGTLASRLSAEVAMVAHALFSQALALDPDNLEAAAGLAQIESYAVVNGYVPLAERAERLAAVEALSGRVLASQPNHVGALKARAVGLRAAGRFEDAIVVTQALLAQSPGDPSACREIGLCRLYLGEPGAAVDWFRQAEQSGPGDPARWTWLQGLGRALLHGGQDEEAVKVLRVLVEAHPEWPFGYGLLAAALLGTGADAQARERYAEFVQRAPAPEARLPAGLVPVPTERLSAGYRAGDARLAQRFAALEAQAQAQPPAQATSAS